LAVRHNVPNCVKLLLENGGDYCAENIDKISPVHLAAKYGRLDILELLLERIKDPSNSKNINDFLDSWKQSPLHYAVLQNQYSCAEKLLKEGCKQLADAIGMTPLLSAASVNAAACVELLLTYKDGDPFVRSNNGKNILNFICKNGNTQLLENVLKWMKTKMEEKNTVCNAIENVDINGITPRNEAQVNGFIDCVKLLDIQNAV